MIHSLFRDCDNLVLDDCKRLQFNFEKGEEMEKLDFDSTL